MSQTWDVIVAGAGPAGSRAAELLAERDAGVLLFDPKAPWEKPCGGGLTAAALAHTPELHELDDVSEPIHELLAVAPGGASVVIPLRRPYRIVSRKRLSEWGLHRAQLAGARFVPAGVRSVERAGGVWRVTDSRGEEYRGRHLVVADGATSRFRRVLAPALKPELAPTRVSYTRRTTPRGRAVFSFLSAAQGYVWDFPRPDHDSVGIGVAPGTYARDDLDGAVDQFQLAEAGDAAALADAGAVIATSAWEAGRFEDLGGRDYVLIGDAGGLADPATGEGLDYALRSARLAAEALADAAGFASYPAAARDAFAGEMRRAVVIRRWLYRPSVADWLIRGARRSPRRALLLMALCDAINEHGSVRAALARALAGRLPDRRAAREVCDCPDGNDMPGPDAGTPVLNQDRLELPLAGLARGDAANQAAAVVRQLPGVADCLVNAVSRRALVVFDAAVLDPQEVVRAFEGAACVDVRRSLVRWHVRVDGVRCGNCAVRLERAIEGVRGVHGVTANAATGSATIVYTPQRTDLAAVRRAVASEGFALACADPRQAAAGRGPCGRCAASAH